MPKAATATRRQAILPTSKPKNRRSIEDLENDVEIDERRLEPGAWEPQWQAQCDAVEADIWTMQDLIPVNAREECLAYLYRLEPAVYNQGGEGSNIGKYQVPATLEQIRKDHGGGKYKMWLKRGPRNLGTKIFAIGDCDPIYKEGQTRRDGKPIGGADVSEKRESTVEVIREVAKIVKGDGDSKAGIDATVSMMNNGFKTILDAHATAAASTTGSKMGDEVFSQLIKRALDPAPAINPLELVKGVFELAKSMQPAPAAPTAPSAPNPTPVQSLNDQFSIVKEIAGVDSISELFKRDRGPAAAPWYAGLIVTALQNLPSMLQTVANMQEQAFRRQLILRNAKPGEEAPGMGMIAEPVPVAAAPPAPTMAPQPGQPVAAEPENNDAIIQRGVTDIVRYFTSGADGGACAVHLVMDVPDFVKLLEPALSDRAQIDQLVLSIPPLNECATLKPNEWNDFVDDFVETVNEYGRSEAPESPANGELISIQGHEAAASN